MLPYTLRDAAQRFRRFAWCCALIGASLDAQDAALAQAAPPICMAATKADTGAVNAIGSYRSDAALIAADKGLFLARAADGAVTVTSARSDGNIGRVLAVYALKDGRALIGTESGLFEARQADDTLTLAKTAGDLQTGSAHLLHELPGIGILVGAEKGLFLAREQNGRFAVASSIFSGQVRDEIHDFLGRGVLVLTGGGWLLVRNSKGNITHEQLGGSGYLRGMRNFPGGALLETESHWFMVREEGNKVWGESFGGIRAGVVDGVGQFPGGLLLGHGESGWFTVRVERRTAVFTPVAGPETRRVTHMARLGNGLLANTWEGWLLARESGGKVTITPLPKKSVGEAYAVKALSERVVLVGADEGLFLVGDKSGTIALEEVRDPRTGPAFMLLDLPSGGMLVGAAAGWFTARDVGGKIAFTPAGQAIVGGVTLNMRNMGYQVHDLAGSFVLIGGQAGLFAAGPAPPGTQSCETR